MYMKKKTLILIVLCACVAVMTIAYANFSQTLNIKNNGTIGSTWDVKIVGITKISTTGSAYEVSAPTYSNNIARFNVGFVFPYDSIVYRISVKNNGSLRAKITSATVGYAGNASYASPTLGGLKAIEFNVPTSNLQDLCLEAGATYTFDVSAHFVNVSYVTPGGRTGRMILTLETIQAPISGC